MSLKDRVVGTLQKIGLLGGGSGIASAGRVVVSGVTASTSATRPKMGLEWLAAYNQQPWLWATVNKISYGVSTLQWGITRTMTPVTLKTVRRADIQYAPFDLRHKLLASMQEQGEAEAIYEHPLLELWKAMCPALPGRAARQLLQVYYELIGETFLVIDRGPRDAWIKSDFTGRPLPQSLWPLPPYWVKRTPTPDKPSFDIENDQLRLKDVPMSEVLWLKNPDPLNPYGRGISGLGSIGDELDADENAAKMIGYSFYNRGRPDVLISLPGWDEKEIKAFRNDWMANLQGVQNALKSHFVNVEAKATQLGYDFQHLQVLELRRFSRDLIRQVQGIPPEILGILDQSNRSTIEASEYIFGKHVVIPRAEVWREFMQTHLVPEYDPRAVIDYATPLQEDKNFGLSVLQGQPHVAKVDDMRKLANLSPLGADGGGDLHIVPQGMTAVKNLAELVQAAPGAPGAGLGLQVPGSTTLDIPGATGAPGGNGKLTIDVGGNGSARPGLPSKPGTQAHTPAGAGPGPFSLTIHDAEPPVKKDRAREAALKLARAYSTR